MKLILALIMTWVMVCLSGCTRPSPPRTAAPWGEWSQAKCGTSPTRRNIFAMTLPRSFRQFFRYDIQLANESADSITGSMDDGSLTWTFLLSSPTLSGEDGLQVRRAKTEEFDGITALVASCESAIPNQALFYRIRRSSEDKETP